MSVDPTQQHAEMLQAMLVAVTVAAGRAFLQQREQGVPEGVALLLARDMVQRTVAGLFGRGPADSTADPERPRPPLLFPWLAGGGAAGDA